MILLLDVLGAGILWFISGADGYQIHEVLCGLAESGNSGKAVPTDLISADDLWRNDIGMGTGKSLFQNISLYIL